MKQTLTFEGTNNQIELLKAEFEMLRIEYTDETLPKIIKQRETELYNLILVHVSRTWERIRFQQVSQEMPQDNITSSYDAIPNITNHIFNSDMIRRIRDKGCFSNWDWGKESKGYAYSSDTYIEQKAREIIYRDFLSV